jgi:hypothetical protein
MAGHLAAIRDMHGVGSKGAKQKPDGVAGSKKTPELTTRTCTFRSALYIQERHGVKSRMGRMGRSRIECRLGGLGERRLAVLHDGMNVSDGVFIMGRNPFFFGRGFPQGQLTSGEHYAEEAC